MILTSHVNPSKVATRYYWNGVVDSVSGLHRRDLAQDFPFSFEPVVEITAILTTPRLVQFERALRNQNIEIVQGQTRAFSGHSDRYLLPAQIRSGAFFVRRAAGFPSIR